MATKANPASKQHATQGSEKRKASAGAQASEHETSAGTASSAKSEDTEHTRERVKESLQDVGAQMFEPGTLKAELGELRDSLKAEIKAELAQMREATGDVVQSTQETVARTGRSAARSVRQNPIPIAMTGIGLAWLFANAKQTRATKDTHPGNGRASASATEDGGEMRASAQRTGREVAKRASNLAHQAGSTIGNARHAATDKVGSVAHGLQKRGRDLGHTAADTFEENPWWFGAAALAAGTLVALAMPMTRREDSLLGSARDGAIEGAQSFAHNALDKVQSAAKNVEQTAAQLAGKRTSES